MRRAQPAVAARGVTARLRLRGRLSPAYDRQGRQPRYRLVRHAGFGMARSQGSFRTLAGAGEFRCGRPPARIAIGLERAGPGAMNIPEGAAGSTLRLSAPAIVLAGTLLLPFLNRPFTI